ncbi:DUF2867 domain-containing protein [Mycobacterium sp.]|uniref:DUF2867 domain-containing protein n=1 Tax=Mycobacterium sp. TaxID=1785 RepID=UPI00127B9FA3|nr:DUF2867 domain-containing protein [Mycobacterium sp.]KAA8969213.1 MAG: SDR family oxidoreductase [Mycobacterium sp.]
MSAGRIRALVTGSTGYIGSRLVPRLLGEGHHVRALARNPARLADVPWRTRAEVVRGDLGEMDSLAGAFEGIDVVYYLVHSMGMARDFAAEEARAVHNTVNAARDAGVRRVVYLGGLHTEGRKLSPHLDSRRVVGDILIRSGIETVVLQAGVVVGSGSGSFEMIRHLTDRLPVMTTPKWVHNKIQPIAIADVLHYLVAAATAPVPMSRTWDIGGPDVLEYGDMMRIYADVARLGKRYLIVLPFLTPRIASLWVGTVTPIPPGLARPLIESLECDAVMRNAEVDTIIARPPDGLTPYRRAVELALRRSACGLVDATWASAESAPAEPLPCDPAWAGAVVRIDERVAVSTAKPDHIVRIAEEALESARWLWVPVAPRLNRHVTPWRIVQRQPGRTLRARAERRAPGQAWLEITVTPRDDGASNCRQRAIFFPRGIPGRLYWWALRPVHTVRLSALLRRIVAAAG